MMAKECNLALPANLNNVAPAQAGAQVRMHTATAVFSPTPPMPYNEIDQSTETTMQPEHDADLKARLKALHRELQETGDTDVELETLLRQLDGDIEKVLERRAEQELDANTYGLGSRTQELAASFAARHPRVEHGLRELGQILSNMGI